MCLHEFERTTFKSYRFICRWKSSSSLEKPQFVARGSSFQLSQRFFANFYKSFSQRRVLLKVSNISKQLFCSIYNLLQLLLNITRNLLLPFNFVYSGEFIVFLEILVQNVLYNVVWPIRHCRTIVHAFYYI